MSRPPPRIADLERFAALYALGCIVSRLIDIDRWEPADIHHLVEGRKRLGHQFTIPLSPWFHRGVPPGFDIRPSEASNKLGPSMAINKRAFTERFGTERQLLELTNELIEAPHDTERMAAAIESWRQRCGLQHVATDAGGRDNVRDANADHHRKVREADSLQAERWDAVWQEADGSSFQD